MTTALLAALTLLALGLLIVGVLALRAWRSAGTSLALLVRYASASSRITSATPSDARDTVHLVLMDAREEQVHFVMVVDPRQRAATVEYRGRRYACVSGSVEDGYFVYRRT